ncbi:hypothetical protein ACNF42_07325 [Cuniculiplasma sp. SKW3]|uniref:hypothetical protein n=1 Tax=Cuniculiplasma sp. SKW3 TaxID=3400170 RepID=UPI003FD481C1
MIPGSPGYWLVFMGNSFPQTSHFTLLETAKVFPSKEITPALRRYLLVLPPWTLGSVVQITPTYIRTRTVPTTKMVKPPRTIAQVNASDRIIVHHHPEVRS